MSEHKLPTDVRRARGLVGVWNQRRGNATIKRLINDSLAAGVKHGQEARAMQTQIRRWQAAAALGIVAALAALLTRVL